MSISSLSSQYISASFSGLVQYSSSGNIYDGNGSQITTLNVTASYVSSGTTTAVGSEGSVQYKSPTGVLAGDANFVYNRTLSSLLIGSENQASGSHSFAAGESVIASGGNSAAFNFDTEASGSNSAAFGKLTVAKGDAAMAVGANTVASGSNQFVAGIYNQGNVSSLLIVGNGSALGRSNAFEVTTSGSVLLSPQQFVTPNAEPTYTGRNGELAITHDGSATHLWIYIDTIGWKGVNLSL
jgi:hypothetical protein